MIEDLLEAECVINHLHDKKIVSKISWRSQNPSDHEYPVHFYKIDAIADISLFIIKRSGKYYIPRSLIKVLSYRHHFDAVSIYSECTVA